MSLFGNLVEALAVGVATVAHESQRPSGGMSILESCCSQLRWGIDEREGRHGIILHFRDQTIGIRKVLVTTGDTGEIGTIMTCSASSLRQAPQQVTEYLLRRNTNSFIAWQMTDSNDGSITFAVGCGVLLQALTPAIFKTYCELVLKEASEFDTKLRSAGVL